MANQYVRYFLCFFLFNISIVLCASKECTGNPDINIQLQTAVSFTKTQEFNNLFEVIRLSRQWEEYANNIENTFSINIEKIVRSANPNDTLKTFKRKVLRTIPFDVKIRFLLARRSFNIEKIAVLYANLYTLPEVQMIINELCSMNVNINDIAAALL
ncbi:hypothetical protein Trydic_g860 [Trypoxylus dichotomus]